MITRSNCDRSVSIVWRIVGLPSSSAGWAAGAAGGQHRDLLVLEQGERVGERRPPGQDIGESGAVGQTEQRVQPRVAQVGVDDADAPLKVLRHRQGEIRRGQGLALAAAGTRDENDVRWRALVVVRQARPKRPVLLRRRRAGSNAATSSGSSRVSRTTRPGGQRRVGQGLRLEDHRWHLGGQRGEGAATGSAIDRMRRTLPSRSAFSRMC